MKDWLRLIAGLAIAIAGGALFFAGQGRESWLVQGLGLAVIYAGWRVGIGPPDPPQAKEGS